MWYAIYIAGIVVIGRLAFLIGKKLSATPRTESKTTTFLIKSIQAIAELAVLEYITEGVTEIKEKKTSLITFKRFFSLSYPEYTTDISIMDEPASQTTAELPGETASKDQISNSDKQ
jgi:hypothetical protein